MRVVPHFMMCVVMLASMPLPAENLEWKGQLSSQITEKCNDNKWRTDVGIQYVPQLKLSRTLSPASLFDTEVAFHGFIQTHDNISSENLKLYRFNIRYATTQSETQIGLQKINFGPAQLLRSLMWFDRLDPRDPLKITEGVYGIRYKYTALNNANFWLWGLYGNRKTKGYEAFPTVREKPEMGGRIQFPVPEGEMALTAHYRRASTGTDEYNESRIGLDGRWDIVIGTWFETVIQRQPTSYLPGSWEKMTTLGVDYTFGIGNGLYAVVEHMGTQMSSAFWQSDEESQMTAIMVSYPLTLFDNLTVFGFYSWKTKDFYSYLGWLRTYDKFIINLSLYNYPASAMATTSTLGTGYGAQLMLIYNH